MRLARSLALLPVAALVAGCVAPSGGESNGCVRIEGSMEGVNGTVSYVLTDGVETWFTDRLPDNLCT